MVLSVAEVTFHYWHFIRIILPISSTDSLLLSRPGLVIVILGLRYLVRLGYLIRMHWNTLN